MSLFQRTFHRLRPTASRFAAQRVRGLDEFFETPTSIPTTEITAGRAWDAADLRKKDFEDLHKLWYVLLKERNMLATQKGEAERLKVDFLHQDRVVKVKKSMARIKGVLTERQIAYDEAVKELEKRREVEEKAQLEAFNSTFKPAAAAAPAKAQSAPAAASPSAAPAPAAKQ
ncbi:54S ribosomal protein L4 mitochondrial [Blastocladiella emersonii ATCC 22665]|nr:54S ribosomal protein L4 mitochondrial [Blastocladiella emersonii ATCC 22665]